MPGGKRGYLDSHKLSPLQLDFLHAFFQREHRFFLTGGAEKLLFGEIRVDPPEEILANKLCALLSRSEIRDLVDVRALESIGYRVEDALEAAQQKDRGLTAAQLGWVLSQIEFGNDLIPPGDVSRSELQNYLTTLIERLANVAFPN